ncbi:F0F1 ATP synthase subunit gamma [Candidatus Microgenomates bacterium]|nr:F0F1 ATP synthase subunit gamma [Candidatus Microgenomates bacterium]
MYQINQIKTYLEEVESLELLAEVYTDIARARLEKVRTGIERNRSFVAEIANVLHIVRVTAEAQGLSAKRKKKVSASLMITSNKRFYYGGLDSRVVDFYSAHTSYTGFVDRFVVGSVGVDILRGHKYPFPFVPIVFGRDLPDQTELGLLADKLNDYQKVFVYYPRFVTVLTQQPSFIDMTGLVSGTAQNPGENYYIFEPEIDKILDFFEQQVMAVLLEQTFLEAELSRIGSQLVAMDTAAINAGNIIREQNVLLQQARRSQLSMQVLEMVTGMRRQQKYE